MSYGKFEIRRHHNREPAAFWPQTWSKLQCHSYAIAELSNECIATPPEDRMSAPPILRLGAVKDIVRFEQHLQALHLNIPCDRELTRGPESPLRWPLVSGDIKIGNRIAVQPMEGWDGSRDGNPTESTIRRW